MERIGDLLKQNAASRKELRDAFGIDHNDKIDTRELDGMLKEYVDEMRTHRSL